MQESIRTIRRIFRLLAAVIALTPAALLTWIVGFGSGGTRRLGRMTQFFGRVSCAVLGLKVTCTGDVTKAAGAMIVSNHRSYLDIPVHASLFCLRFAAKEELRREFPLNLILSSSRPVWIHRGSPSKTPAALKEFRRTLEEGLSMLVYPEGTSSDGSGLLPFKSTAFAAVKDGGFALCPVLIAYDVPEGDYRRETYHGNVSWYGDQSFFAHLWWVLGLRSCRVRVFVGDVTHCMENEDRKEFAVRIHDRMAEQYAQILDQSKRENA